MSVMNSRRRMRFLQGPHLEETQLTSFRNR
jgi:hypothetical protein